MKKIGLGLSIALSAAIAFAVSYIIDPYGKFISELDWSVGPSFYFFLGTFFATLIVLWAIQRNQK